MFEFVKYVGRVCGVWERGGVGPRKSQSGH